MAKALNLHPRKAKPITTHTEKAWWYEESHGISIYMASDGGPTLACFIRRDALKSYLGKRSAASTTTSKS